MNLPPRSHRRAGRRAPGARRLRARLLSLAVPTALATVIAVAMVPSPPAMARSTFPGPLMGWSSWSVESSTHPGYGSAWLNETNIKNAASAVASKLKSAGYRYIDIDSFWSDHWDGNGIPAADPGRFPHGMAAMASYIHGLGLKMGIYTIVGLPKAAYSANDPIQGTSCHTRDIAVQPLTSTNGWGTAWKINYGNPCAQAYIDSVVNRFASWGVNMIKVDGVTSANVPDIAAFSKAIDASGRQIWLTASAWPVPLSVAGTLRPYPNSARVDTDVECYCDTISSWDHSVINRWNDLPAWLPQLSSSYLPDLDSMPINNNTGQGVQDGINDTERQSVMNFWSMASAPLYVGGDVFFINSSAVHILTNPEVIAVDRSKVIPTRVTSGTTQVWKKTFGGATYVAVYNLGPSATSITVNWSQLGLSGTLAVRDVDARANLGSFTGQWTAPNVPSHGSRLIKVG